MAEIELREPTFWVLTVLASGRRHGYALMNEARDLSEGRVNLKVATLYASLDRLQRQGLVFADGDEIVDGRTRRYFRLTESGLARLREEVARMEASARAARAQIRASALPLHGPVAL